MISLIYLGIVALFGLLSLTIIYHLYRFGVNKVVVGVATLVYIILSIIVILDGLTITITI